jgi:hypothetical protein
MKVADAPITVLTNPAQGEIMILTSGVRIVMTSDEAGWLWAELGSSLRKVYADHPERCPPKYEALLSQEREPHEREPSREASTGERPVPLERVLEGIIAYAQRSNPNPPPDGVADRNADTRDVVAMPEVESPAPAAGLFGRALGKLTGR